MQERVTAFRLNVEKAQIIFISLEFVAFLFINAGQALAFAVKTVLIVADFLD